MPSKVIWVLGHSFVRHTAGRLQHQRVSKPAGLKEMVFLWRGVGGLRIGQLRRLVDETRAHEGLQSPDLIILHLGGNDMVDLGRLAVREALLTEIAWLGRAFLQARIAWSCMIPCRTWGDRVRSRALNVSVRRLNGEMAKLCSGPGRLCHIPNKLIRGDQMFHHDGVHLSDIGTDAWTNCIWSFEQNLFCGREGEEPVGPGHPCGGKEATED